MYLSFENNPIQYVYILVGMRGVGKSTLGCAAASMIPKSRFMDMDHYFSQQTGMTVAAFVALYGWPAFRDLEVQYMESMVKRVTTWMSDDEPRPWIVSVGGGVLETEKGRALFHRLWDWNRTMPCTCRVFIIHLQRSNMASFVQTMEDSHRDSGRPSLLEPLDAVWQRRKQHYHQYSHFDFYLSAESELDAAASMRASCRSFVDFIQGLAHRQSLRTAKQQYCLSLMHPDSLDSTALHGMDMVELRADAWPMVGHLDVSAALSHVRATFGATQLPILFTCRSKEQGGGASDWCPADIRSAQHTALRLGVAYLDLEMSSDIMADSTVDTLVEQAIRCEAGIVLSYHELRATGFGAAWRRVYDQMQRFQQKWHVPMMMMKLISTWGQPSDLEHWQQWTSSLGRDLRPAVITHLMGTEESARSSRLQNSLTAPIVFLTFDKAAQGDPAKIETTVVPAASGQYTVQSLHQGQMQASYRPSCKSFYLFGFPVRSSPSPALHTAGFRALGLPYQYTAVEAEALTPTVVERIQSKDFGGASVTIPLKMAVGAVVQELRYAREHAIGALNTLIPDEGHERLIGANTDWIALYACLLDRIQQLRLECLGSEERVRMGQVHVLILGAGATSRSSLYAVQRLFGPSEAEKPGACVWVWNRTVSKAEALAAEFRVHVLETLCLAPLFDSAPSVCVLVNTLPPSAQVEIAWPGRPDGCEGTAMIVADYSYLKGKETPFVSFYRQLGHKACSVITGPQLLLEQALHQFRYWTGRMPPKSVMEQAMWQAIQ